jgi:hypothetical protein
VFPVVESKQGPTPPMKGEVSLSYCVDRPRIEVVVVVVVVVVEYLLLINIVVVVRVAVHRHFSYIRFVFQLSFAAIFWVVQRRPFVVAVS